MNSTHLTAEPLNVGAPQITVPGVVYVPPAVGVAHVLQAKISLQSSRCKGQSAAAWPAGA